MKGDGNIQLHVLQQIACGDPRETAGGADCRDCQRSSENATCTTAQTFDNCKTPIPYRETTPTKTSLTHSIRILHLPLLPCYEGALYRAAHQFRTRTNLGGNVRMPKVD